MRIALDLRIALLPGYTERGFGVYTSNYAKALLENDIKNEYYLIGYQNLADLKLPKVPQERIKILYPLLPPLLAKASYKSLQRYEKNKINDFVRDNKIDILLMFSSGDRDYRVNTEGQHKTIMVCHDLIPLLFREHYLQKDKDFRAYMNHLKEFEKADWIITNSKSTRRDLLSEIYFPKQKVTPVYPGVKLIKTQEEYDFCNKETRPEEYLLYAGGFDYRKNVKLLLEAFRNLAKDRQFNKNLVLAGGIHQAAVDEIEKFMRENNLEERIEITGSISDAKLRFLYENAFAYVFPSLYEGFGLPLIEALEYNCPVIAARNSALAEFGDDMVLYFESDNVEDLIAKIKMLENDPSLSWKMLA
ncbi:glycosyltransferase family 4 protein, partial [Patescibacteria group bacterium]|nr:glycosyltransferase family 4 protein [Patescibacteria group bacterium]